jgi:hypothetical protein
LLTVAVQELDIDSVADRDGDKLTEMENDEVTDSVLRQEVLELTVGETE